MPQIELMQSDLPHTLFNDRKQNTKKVDARCERLNREALERSRKRWKSQRAVTTEELFSGAADDK